MRFSASVACVACGTCTRWARLERACEFGKHRVVADVQHCDFESFGQGGRCDQVAAEADAGMGPAVLAARANAAAWPSAR
jgi:hypothetical protein